MSSLHEVGERDGWRCWLCDEPVDPDASVNADRGPSVDAGAAPKGRSKSRKAVGSTERLAHRSCNTRKGAVTPVVPWGGGAVRRRPGADRGDRRPAQPQGRP